MGNNVAIDTSENNRTNWICAIDAWDYCDPKPLGEMVLKHGVPNELREIVASMLSGERKQKTKATTKLEPAQRMAIASVYVTLRKIPEAALNKRNKGVIEHVANREKIEVIEQYRSFQEKQRRYDERIEKMLGVSTRTLKSLALEFNSKLKNYPNI